MRVQVLICVLSVVLLSACAPRVKLFTDGRDPLNEYVIEGEAEEKIALVEVRGTISDAPRSGFLRQEPSLVQDVAGRLRLAAMDDDVRAVVLKVDSPGGTVTASDMLYEEIARFKKESGKPVVAAFLNVAASGGYYASLPADRIVAHPTCITGSVGVIFLHPKVEDLLGKIGVDVAVAKSGEHKDMLSPFRPDSEAERAMLQGIIDEMNQRFQELVARHRHPAPDAAREIATARIFSARQAQALGLVDEVGTLRQAIESTKALAELPEDARIVTYRRSLYPDDTIYNSADARSAPAALVHLPGEELLPPRTGLYYLWLPGE